MGENTYRIVDDAKVKKALVDFFESHHDNEVFCGVMVMDILNWLDKH